MLNIFGIFMLLGKMGRPTKVDNCIRKATICCKNKGLTVPESTSAYGFTNTESFDHVCQITACHAIKTLQKNNNKTIPSSMQAPVQIILIIAINRIKCILHDFCMNTIFKNVTINYRGY